MVRGDAAVAARLRVRERAQQQRHALAAVLAAEQDVARAEQRRAELAARARRIVADACTRRAAALQALVEVCGSPPVAADLLGISVPLLRRRLRDGEPTANDSDSAPNGDRRSQA